METVDASVERRRAGPTALPAIRAPREATAQGIASGWRWLTSERWVLDLVALHLVLPNPLFRHDRCLSFSKPVPESLPREGIEPPSSP